MHYACLRNATVESIEALAESNPNWILACNNAGYSPMQILCKNGRINDRIVTIFSRLCGSKVFSSVDACGNTPLHSVMREETNVEVLRALIHAYPDALHMRTLYEDTPLSLACLRKVHPDVMREVAHASYDGLDSSGTDGTHRLSPLVIRNRAGQTPIGIAMEEYRKASAEAPTRFCVTSDPTPEQTRAFNALSALVKILHYGPSKDGGRNESLVSACLLLHRNEVRLDPAFIRRALLVNPGEAKMVDKDLNYPLHVEASIPVEKMILLDAPHVPTTGCCCGGTCHKRVGVLQMLVEIYPDAAKHRNKDGDFPLNLMVCNGRPWDNTFAFVVRAYPEALHWVDNLSPKIAAHVLAKVSSGCGVDTLYSLVRARPAMLWSYEESS